MLSVDELKSMVCRKIDTSANDIIGVAKAISKNPETGFREIETSTLVARKFRELGIEYRDKLAITGIKGMLQCDSDGPTVAVLGELDSLIIPDHPQAKPETGTVHACGHNAQIAMLIGVATALNQKEVLGSLSGRIALMAVPAEEYIEIEYREQLRKEGKISFLGGKPELIKLGEFDDVDMAMMTHLAVTKPEINIIMGGTSNGSVAKQMQFTGKSAHAGSAPHAGINALNAAMIALSAIHTQRETFKDDDTIRVHPIITRGGDAVNIVPSNVTMETFVRGKTLEAIKNASEKVDRCLRAGAMAVGGSVRITTLPGYFPMANDPGLQNIYKANAVSLIGKKKVLAVKHHGTGSTDMGDVSYIMPAIHPYAGGATGTAHGNDYAIDDYEAAVINPTKILAMTVIDLLAESASRGNEVINKSKPQMTKEEYLAALEELLSDEIYNGQAIQ